MSRAQADERLRDGQMPTRNEPSPKPRNKNVPDHEPDPGRRDRQQSRGG